MEISPIPLSDVEPAPGALQQSPGYGRALRLLGRRTTCFAIHHCQTRIAQVQLVQRRVGPLQAVWVPRGPVWLGNPSAAQRLGAMHHLLRALPGRNAWIISPEDADDLCGVAHQTLVTAPHMAEMDLSVDRAQRLAAQHGKWRNRLRHAQKSGLVVEQRGFCATRDAGLMKLEEAQRAANRYRALPLAFLRAWDTANAKASRLFTVRRGQMPLAYMLVLLHAPAATYHIGWTSPEGRRLSAHNLALWEAQNWLAGHGFVRFDLGHVDTQNTPGLARFKIGGGARVRATGPTCLHLPLIRRPRRIRHDAA